MTRFTEAVSKDSKGIESSQNEKLRWSFTCLPWGGIVKNVFSNRYIRYIRVYSTILLVSSILFSYQNCAPVGSTLENVSIAKNGTEPTDSTGDTGTGGGGLLPPPPPPGDDEPPVIIDPCLGNKDPELFGELLSNGNTVNSISNRNGTIGIQEGSGTVLPADIRIVGSSGPGEAQALSLSCQVTGNSIDVDCDNNGFSQRDGKLTATISLNQRRNTQCVSGTVTVTVKVEDACLAQSANQLQFTVNITDGCLPEQKKVALNDASVNAKFGSFLDMNNNYAVVAAPGDDENGNSSGAAYVFRKSGLSWVADGKLMASDSADTAWGELSSVAIYGDTIVAGAPYHNGVGAVFVFSRASGSWQQTQKLVPTSGNSTGGDNFGYSVDISSSLIAVGANHDKSIAVQAGAVYLYRWAATSYVAEGKLIAPNAAARHLFGSSVSLDGETVVAGAPIGTVYASLGSGSAHVFSKNSNLWSGSQLTYSGANGDRFGESIGISGGRIIVGAPKANSGNNVRNGAAFVFSGAGWANSIKLSPNQSTFGTSVTIEGNQALVGAPKMNGNMGGAYYYLLDGSANQTDSEFLILARDRTTEDQLGQGVGLSGGTALVGAWIDDLNDTETGTSQPVDNAGSIYFIELP